jgi:hypothetical protein
MHFDVPIYTFCTKLSLLGDLVMFSTACKPLNKVTNISIVSPTSPTPELIGFGYPYLPALFVLRLQFRRLTKKQGVLNEDAVYS